MGNTSSSNRAAEFGQAVHKILHSDVAVDDHAFWRTIFTASPTFWDIFHGIDRNEVRLCRRHAPWRFATFLYKCIEQVSAFATSAPPGDKGTAASAAVQLLSRLLPLALEPFSDAVLEPPAPPQAGPVALQESVRVPAQPLQLSAKSPFCDRFSEAFFLNNLQCRDAEPTKVFALSDRNSLSLSVVLMNALVGLCFVPGFTIGAKQVNPGTPTAAHPLVEPHRLWTTGIGVDPRLNIHFDEGMLYQRIALCKCLISALSRSAMSENVLAGDPLRDALLDVRICPLGPTLVASLFNFVCVYQPYGVMPYTSHWIANAEELVQRSTQLLTILLDPSVFFREQDAPPPVVAIRDADAAPAVVAPASPPRGDDSAVANQSQRSVEVSPLHSVDDLPSAARSHAARASNPSAATTASSAAIALHPAWSFLASCTASDGDFLRDGLCRLISVRTYAKLTVLPGSQRSLRCTEEFFVLVWKLLDRCEAFRKSLCRNSDRLIDIVCPMLDFAVEAAQNVSHTTGFQLVTILMLKLSSEREFCTALNRPFLGQCSYPIQPFVGTYFDLIVLALHQMLLSKHPWVADMHVSIHAIISNLAPFATTVSTTTAVKLVNLLVAYANPAWLSPAQPNHAVRVTLLEQLVLAISSMLQYNYPGTRHVLYALVRSASPIRKLWAGINTKEIAIPEAVARQMTLFTIMCAIDFLEPIIAEYVTADPNFDVAAFLLSTTLVGKLPVPHPIIVQRFLPRAESEKWLTGCVWTYIYVHSYPSVLDPRTVAVFSARAA